MEDSFRVRVDKVFGSLIPTSTSSSSSSSTSPSPYSSTSLWSLSDEEIEKKEWERDAKPYPSYADVPISCVNRAAQPEYRRHLGNQLCSDLQELNDDEEDDDDASDDNAGKTKKKMNDESEQIWEVRSSIGLDCTLDYEEEEDEYDKVAVGRENPHYHDRLYLRDMLDYGIDVNTHKVLPESFKQTIRDPRANHMAARLRLREDAEAAGDFHTLNLSDVLDPGIPPKPILKKREYSVSEKSSKRVRFLEQAEQSLAAKDASVEETTFLGQSPSDQSFALGEAADGASDLPRKCCPNEEAAAVPDDGAGLLNARTYVPDYLRNPTRYTRYNLDSSTDIDEASNQKAYMDFLNLLKKKPSSTESQDEEASLNFQLPTFTPRKKPNSTLLAEKDQGRPSRREDAKGKAFSVSIALQDDEYCGMDEVRIESLHDKSTQKLGRRYRKKSNVGSDNVTSL